MGTFEDQRHFHVAFANTVLDNQRLDGVGMPWEEMVRVAGNAAEGGVRAVAVVMDDNKAHSDVGDVAHVYDGHATAVVVASEPRDIARAVAAGMPCVLAGEPWNLDIHDHEEGIDAIEASIHGVEREMHVTAAAMDMYTMWSYYCEGPAPEPAVSPDVLDERVERRDYPTPWSLSAGQVCQQRQLVLPWKDPKRQL